MKVHIIQITQDPIDVMWVAARTCYSNKSPIDMFNKRYIDSCAKYTTADIKESDFVQTDTKENADKKWNLVKKVLDSGHQSIAEHVYFTFAIEGVDRALTHQLVRHRHCTFSQQSQRYVQIKEDQNKLEDLFCGDSFNYPELYKILNKYFVDGDKISNVNGLYYALDSYLQAIKNGEPAEEARRFLPNATKTNIIMSCNFRELIHMCNLRLCTRAQKPIRDLFKEIVNCVIEKNDKLASYLVPQCEVYGFCTEEKCCGRTISIKELRHE